MVARKVARIKHDYHEHFTHNNGACKQNNLTALIYLLANGLYKITTESTQLILDVEKFGASSDLIDPTQCTESVIVFFFYESSLRHSMDSTEMPLSIFHVRIYH